MAVQTFELSESVSAKRRFYVFCVDATDGITPETGEASGQPQISKNGAAFANTSATLVAVGNGCYYVELTAAELNTLGKIIVRYKSANTAEFQDVGYVQVANGVSSDELQTLLIKLTNKVNYLEWKLKQEDAGAAELKDFNPL